MNERKLLDQSINLAKRLLTARGDLIFKVDHSTETIADKVTRLNRIDRLMRIIDRAFWRVTRRELRKI